MDLIETHRLRLEPLDSTRLEEFVALTANPDAMRYWHRGGPFTRDLAMQNFAASLARIREFDFGRRWIVSREDGAGLGFVETKHFGPGSDDISPDEVEIGWMIEPSAWGRGYATEAGAATRDEAFERLGLQSIVAVHHPENSASRRVCEKLGMAFERDLLAKDGWPYCLHRLEREHWTPGQPTARPFDRTERRRPP